MFLNLSPDFNPDRPQVVSYRVGSIKRKQAYQRKSMLLTSLTSKNVQNRLRILSVGSGEKGCEAVPGHID